MLFRFKKFTRGPDGSVDKSKFVLDEMNADNEDMLMQVSVAMGEPIEIVERVGTPVASQPIPVPQGAPAFTPEELAAQGMIPAPQGIAPFRPAGQTIPVPDMAARMYGPPPSPKVIEFQDNGVSFKVEGTKVFKKGWVDVDMKEYRVVVSQSSNNQEVILEEREGFSTKVQKLDWVPVGG